MSFCLLALGSNLGDRARNFDFAISRLRSWPSIRVLAESRRFETKPLGGPLQQPGFLNAAVLVESDLSPLQLIEMTQETERLAGRVPSQRWDARPLDIDLLLVDDLRLHSDRLMLPHPWLPVRRFVLEPAKEIAAAMLHPELGWSIGQMFEHLASVPQRFVVMPSPFDSELPRISAELRAEFIPRPLPSESADRDSLGIPTDRQAIESEQSLRRVLLESTWCDESPEVICGFWPGETHAQPTGDTKELPRRVETIPDPKLLIYCRFQDPTQEPGAESVGSEFVAGDRREKRFPWLELRPVDTVQFADEVSSAFRSMR